MEGLLINAVLRGLKNQIPAKSLGWVFPDDGSAALLLENVGNLLLRYRPPNPIITLEPAKFEGDPRTPFQRLLATRVKGTLLSIQQVKLDRVVLLEFEGEKGFLDVAPTRLVFELTGRNANLIVCDLGGKIIGLDRTVTSEINRFREVKTGLQYSPPPPYNKIDPRVATLEDYHKLVGKPLSKAIQQTVDGISKELALELCKRILLTPETLIDEANLPVLVLGIADLVANPGGRTNLSAELSRDWELEETESLRKPLREALLKQLKTLQARLGDYQKSLARLDETTQLRNWGDLLMAYSSQIEVTKTVELEDFDGNPIVIPLEPTLSAVQNAEKFYIRAKRLESNAEKALELEPKTLTEIAELEQELRELELLPIAELSARNRKLRERGPTLGLRLQSPGGYEVWIGRSSKENDLLTRSAHSEDLWFHVQGIPGSHVILRTQGRNAGLPDLLHAAQLAAFYSKAKGEKNVAVDYTSKKHVWRPRKAAAGQVLYTQGKTLFVDAIVP